MTASRRTFLAVTAATAVTAGCLRGSDETDDGNGAPTTTVPEEPRVDDPPYDVETPPNDRDGWNEDYLCENMAAESALSFQRASSRRPDSLLSAEDPGDGDAYAVRALTSAEAVRSVFDMNEGGDDPGQPVDRIDFEEFLVLVVEDGYGSGSVSHHWKRAETTDRGLRLHGCLRLPFERTDDLTARYSTLKVERPAAFEFARVSLTVGADRRVHFNSTEGVVSVDSEG